MEWSKEWFLILGGAISIIFWFIIIFDTLSVLGPEEGFTVKYTPPPEGVPEGTFEGEG